MLEGKEKQERALSKQIDCVAGDEDFAVIICDSNGNGYSDGDGDDKVWTSSV